MLRRLVAIVGPTASGKSAIALQLARELGGEIVNADSRQIYRGMDIGTAKPTAKERRIVPHHLFDIADPADGYSLAPLSARCPRGAGVYLGAWQFCVAGRRDGSVRVGAAGRLAGA